MYEQKEKGGRKNYHYPNVSGQKGTWPDKEQKQIGKKMGGRHTWNLSSVIDGYVRLAEVGRERVRAKKNAAWGP